MYARISLIYKILFLKIAASFDSRNIFQTNKSEPVNVLQKSNQPCPFRSVPFRSVKMVAYLPSNVNSFSR